MGMARYARAGRMGGRMRRLLMGIIVGSGLSGCGSGGGSSQALQSAAAGSQTSAVATTTTTASSPASTGCSATSFVPNFATEVDASTGMPNQLRHWAAFPTRVYFVPGAFVTPERKAQALAGFNWWVQATNSAVRFQEVGTAASATIVVQYETRGDTHYGAVTEYHANSKSELVDATITFNMTYLTDVADITPVAAHEFGHALGIGGHSGDPNDVMSSTAQVYSRTSLSVRDVNTLETAYCGLPDALNTSPASASSNTLTSGTDKGTGQTAIVRCGFAVR